MIQHGIWTGTGIPVSNYFLGEFVVLHGIMNELSRSNSQYIVETHQELPSILPDDHGRPAG